MAKKAERDALFKQMRTQIEAVAQGSGLDEAVKEGLAEAGGESKSMEMLAVLLGVDTAVHLLVMSKLRKGEIPLIGRPACHQCREVVLQDGLWAAPYALSPFTLRPVRTQKEWDRELGQVRRLMDSLEPSERALLSEVFPGAASPSPLLCLLVFCGEACGKDFSAGVRRTNLDDLFKL